MNFGGTTMSDIPWPAVAPILVLGLAFVAYCIVDIARHDVRYLPKWGWVLVCCLVSMPVGAIIYLIIGRDEGRES
jgi:hypothetical protein